jgi:tetratricopeptide (TPR) repeat protein
MRKLILIGTLLTVACAKEESQAPTGATATSGQAAEPQKAAPPAQPELKEISVTSSSPEAVDQFKKGRDLIENARAGEAVPFFKKAIELDPNFALAHAYLGMITPDAEGVRLVETAMSHAATLSEAERTLVELALAEKRGEVAKTEELQAKLQQLAPTDWRVHASVGYYYFRKQSWEKAGPALKKAVELNPKAGSVYNQLGYTAMFQGRKEEAIDAFKKYAELMPNEPNPHDSLGEALLASGKLEEAEAAFAKAIEVAPAFWAAWQGIAQTRALRGDWAGAEDALKKSRDAATTAVEKNEATKDLVWTLFAAGKTKDALKMLDEAEKQLLAEKLPVLHAFVPMDRGAMLVELGKAKDVLKQVELGWDRGAKANAPGMAQAGLKRYGLFLTGAAHAKLGHKEDVKKAVEAFAEELKKDPDNARAQSRLHDLYGIASLANGDPKGAVEHFAQCIDSDVLCVLHRIEAEEKVGNKAGADAAKEKLIATPLREPGYLYVRQKLGTIQKS